VEIRRRIADFIAKIGKKKIECGSAFRTKKRRRFFSYITWSVKRFKTHHA
jgi:isopropylmalate/homocitrate/citramalate synthase